MSAAAVVSLALPVSALQAQDEEDLAPLAFLGLTAAEGKTTADAEAGKSEINQLVAPLIHDALASIPRVQGRKVVVTTPSHPFDLRAYYFAQTRLLTIQEILGRLPANCEAPAAAAAQAGGKTESAGLDTSASALLQTGLSLMRTDTALTGIATDISDEFLLNTLLFHQPDAMVGSDMARLDASGGLYRTYREALLQLGVWESAKCDKDKTHSVNYTFAKGQLLELVKAGEKGAASVLEQAMLIEPAFTGDAPPLILKLRLEKANGTMISRKNIWTTLGAQSLSFRAATVISYRLIDPAGAVPAKSGYIRCVSQPTGYRAIGKSAGEEGNDGRTRAATSCKAVGNE
jgi:hypothetical protein